MVSNEFIPTEQAKMMKELGFDEKCLRYSPVETHITNCQISSRSSEGIRNSERAKYDISKQIIALPTWRQAFNWFRKRYSLHGYIDYTSQGQRDWMVVINKTDYTLLYVTQQINKSFAVAYGGRKGEEGTEFFTSPEDAESFMLDKLIDMARDHERWSAEQQFAKKHKL